MQRLLAGALAAGLLLTPLAVLELTTAAGAIAEPLSPQQAKARLAAPVILTGAQLPEWSRLAATGVAEPYPSGAATTGDGRRTAHNGRITIPPDARTGADVDKVVAFRWTGTAWQEVRVQVDQRFPHFLANGHSDFSTYSGTDEELTYSWARDTHSAGDESWKNVFGQCISRKARTVDEVKAAIAAGVVQLGPEETEDDYLSSKKDPVPTLDDDDEITFMARDTGPEAPAGQAAPTGTSNGQAVRIVDPLDPSASTFVYLFQRSGGSTFTADTSYVHMIRDYNADEWIDRYSFAGSDTVKDPETLGTSNTGYGANLTGTVCRTAQPNDAGLTTPDGTARSSTDRFPRDGMTVSTPTYRTTASGRWMVRAHQITRPGTERDYGPDLISRWKGRAFQQSPDSTISLVGFEDEQVNWEANASLLGWRQGPVRAIREVWGADSGTNVTKTETYYRDADTYAYHVRVHPIPSDGLYTSWNYKPENVSTYYNLLRPEGVPIDGVNDEQVPTSVDQLPGDQLGIPCPWAGEAPCPGDPAYFDAPDPTFDLASAINRPEQVAGPHGGLVYEFEFTGPTSALNATAVPYYRDDACLDDGTGDDAVPRPWPGEASSDARVKKGYVDYWKAHGAPADLTYEQLDCANTTAELKDATRPPWRKRPFAALFGQHGIHFFATGDSDNAFGPKPLTEVVGQQWRFSVPMATPTNVVTEYHNNVTAKLQAFTAPYGQSPPSSASPSPSASASPSASPTASASPSGSASPSATATSSASPSATPTASVSSSPSGTTTPPSTCTTTSGNLPVHIDTPTINATGLASVTVTRARPGAAVELQGYSQNHYGTETFGTDRTPVDRRGVADANGAITFNDLRPASNTRVRAREAACAYASGAQGAVIGVRAMETLRVSRLGRGSYVFSGESIPARPGGLIVSLYRIVGAPCGPGVRPADCPGELFLTQARAQSEDAPGAGSYRIPVTFRSRDLDQRIQFVVKTGQDAQNLPGRSNVRSLLVY